jgi:hypothetical protein
MSQTLNAYGSSSASAVASPASTADRLLTLFVFASMGALGIVWFHFSPFASMAMAR